MSITLNRDAQSQNIDTGVALKTAKLAQNQQEIEAKMVAELITGAVIDTAPAQGLNSSGSVGTQINIKV